MLKRGWSIERKAQSWSGPHTRATSVTANDASPGTRPAAFTAALVWGVGGPFVLCALLSLG